MQAKYFRESENKLSFHSTRKLDHAWLKRGQKVWRRDDEHLTRTYDRNDDRHMTRGWKYSYKVNLRPLNFLRTTPLLFLGTRSCMHKSTGLVLNLRIFVTNARKTFYIKMTFTWKAGQASGKVRTVLETFPTSILSNMPQNFEIHHKNMYTCMRWERIWENIRKHFRTGRDNTQQRWNIIRRVGNGDGKTFDGTHW